MYCFDTDVLSALLRKAPPLALIRRFARTPPADQFTTTITLGELCYGAARRGDPALAGRIEGIIAAASTILPFDEAAARTYGSLRAELEAAGRRLAEPDLRIGAIVLVNDLTLVTGSARHFARVPGLRIENWLSAN